MQKTRNAHTQLLEQSARFPSTFTPKVMRRSEKFKNQGTTSRKEEKTCFLTSNYFAAFSLHSVLWSRCWLRSRAARLECGSPSSPAGLSAARSARVSCSLAFILAYEESGEPQELARLRLQCCRGSESCGWSLHCRESLESAPPLGGPPVWRALWGALISASEEPSGQRHLNLFLCLRSCQADFF